MTALSIVVPCYNEEACLGVLHERLSAAARTATGDDYEIVLINDGSRDDSWAIMRRSGFWFSAPAPVGWPTICTSRRGPPSPWPWT